MFKIWALIYVYFCCNWPAVQPRSGADVASEVQTVPQCNSRNLQTFIANKKTGHMSFLPSTMCFGRSVAESALVEWPLINQMLLEYRVQSKKEFLTSPFFPFPLFYLAAIICNRSSCGWCRRGIWRGWGRGVGIWMWQRVSHSVLGVLCELTSCMSVRPSVLVCYFFF